MTPGFQLSAGQLEATDMVAKFLEQDEVRVARLTGYAGTGKTTLLRIIAEICGEPEVLAPTGKAALRCSEATGLPAMTAHRFLYKVEEDHKTGKPNFILKSVWDPDFSLTRGSLIIVDEASMLGYDVWCDLFKLAPMMDWHILLVGDPFQLQPVERDSTKIAFSALDIETPFKVHMTEVIRQALDSPIIKASMLLRGRRPEHEAMGLLQAVGASKLIQTVMETREAGGVTLCFTNARRHQINNDVRLAMGYEPGVLMPGEPLLVVRNNYKLDRFNGEIVDFGDWLEAPHSDKPMPVVDRFSGGTLNMSFGIGTVENARCTLSPEQITGRSENVKVGDWIIRKDAKRWFKKSRDAFSEEEPPPHLDCNWGYALTGHKAQGSEWAEVLVVLDDSMGALRGIERARFLYTVLTRGKTTVRYVYLKGRAT